MLPTHTANLAPVQQKRLHPAFLANEQAYLQLRSGLLAQYRGQWVAVQNGNVIAASPDLMEIMDRASAAGGHPYVARVGVEDDVVFRVRRAVFASDQSYQPFPLPRVNATFLNHSESHSQQHSDVIPDTGADISVLPDSDCATIDLFNSPYLSGMAGGVIGGKVTTLFYRGKVEIDGRHFSALIQPIPAGQERIIGRDVLNQQRVLFDGPAGQVIVDP